MLSYQEIKELMETQTNDMISEDYVLIGEISILFEAKNSNPNSISYRLTQAGHDAYPEWGAANHNPDMSKDFGARATRSSSLAAIQAHKELEKKVGRGNVDPNNKEHVKHISRAIHGSASDFGGKSRGWSAAADNLGSEYQNDAKKAQRGKLSSTRYDDLDASEQEKDDVLARATINHINSKRGKK